MKHIILVQPNMVNGDNSNVERGLLRQTVVEMVCEAYQMGLQEREGELLSVKSALATLRRECKIPVKEDG